MYRALRKIGLPTFLELFCNLLYYAREKKLVLDCQCFYCHGAYFLSIMIWGVIFLYITKCCIFSVYTPIQSMIHQACLEGIVKDSTTVMDLVIFNHSTISIANRYLKPIWMNNVCHFYLTNFKTNLFQSIKRQDV